jgi:hypothetical protein
VMASSFLLLLSLSSLLLLREIRCRRVPDNRKSITNRVAHKPTTKVALNGKLTA